MNNIYSNDEYLVNNISLHEEDTPWKIERVLPLVNRFVGYTSKKEINVLDVGGGAGLILKAVAIHLKKNHGIKVNKYALDLSPGILKIQKLNNPDLVRGLNEDICGTSFGDKAIDLALMVDILEHVPNDKKALEELKRISSFVIFKVPLENNYFAWSRNKLSNVDIRKLSEERYGHVNFYTYQELRRRINGTLGEIKSASCANVFDYFRRSRHYNGNMRLKNKLFFSLMASLSRILPLNLYSRIFGDFAILLVECY